MRFRLPQTLVYWAPTGAGRQGRQTFASPVEFPCRWEDGYSEVIGEDGVNVACTGQIFLVGDVAVGGAVLLGGLQDLGSSFPSNPMEDKRVREIITRGKVPSLTNRQVLCTGGLR